MITVPFTFVATVATIEYAGARPVFVDIDPEYHTMDPAALERAITPRTRAVVRVLTSSPWFLGATPDFHHGRRELGFVWLGGDRG